MDNQTTHSNKSIIYASQSNSTEYDIITLDVTAPTHILPNQRLLKALIESNEILNNPENYKRYNRLEDLWKDLEQ